LVNNYSDIVILNHHATAPDTGGGGRHFKIANYLSNQDFNFTILASSYDRSKKKYFFDKELVTKKFNDNLKFVRFKTKPAYNNILSRFLNYHDYKRKAARYSDFKGEPDVIIASSVHPLAWVAGYKLSRKYGAKFIVEVRDLWPLSLYEDFSSIIRKFVFYYFERFEKKYYRKADAIITTAPYAYEYMKEKYDIDEEKVFHIPHSINIDKFDKYKTTKENCLSEKVDRILDDNFCVTYTGSLTKSEGLSTLVKAGKYLSGIDRLKIVIVGGGDEKERLKNIIESKKLNNVIMIDKQPKEFIPPILNKSEILFCGLIDRKVFKYGISKNKFYEYMAAQKPIIFASNVRDSLIDKAESGITIEPHKPEKLADTIKYLYNNIDTKAQNYASNGRDYVEKYHTISNIAKKLIKVIECT